MSDTTLILGAGLAGLSCAHHLGERYVVIEREPHAGGTARSVRRGAYTFDLTGHWLHLRDERISRLVFELMGDELVQVQRRAEIHSHGVRTPYPFQANTHGLPAEVVADCVLGYFRAREAELRGELPPPRTFEDYIRRRMGDGIAEHFMIPYNTKLWTVAPARMAYEWCGRFVPVPTPEEVVHGAVRPAGAGHRLGYNSSFWYPREGGIGRLPEKLAAGLRGAVRCGLEAVRVDWRAKLVTLSNGETIRYRDLVSTLPLPELVQRLVEPPAAVLEAAARLRATSVTYWDVGVARPNGADDAHWIYFPEPGVPFYRAGSPSAAVSSLAPAGHRSYYVEVSHPRDTPCPTSDAEVLAGLYRVGLLAEGEEPTLVARTTIDYAYVIMDEDYGAARGVVLDWLAAQSVQSVGRYGAWTYDSMEGAMVQGREAAARVRGS